MSQKLSLGAFLCLSLVMVCLAIIRVSKVHGVSGIDVIWEFFWQHMEATVAILMGSLTVFRSLFIHKNNSNNSPRDRAEAAGPRSQHSYRIRFLRRRKDFLDLQSRDTLPKVPGATLTGLRTFIRGNNRDTLSNTRGTLTGISQQDTIAENNDSHQLFEAQPVSSENSQIGTQRPIHPKERVIQGVSPTYQVRR